MKRAFWIGVGALVLPLTLAWSAPRILDKRLHHLRSGAEREWTEFPPQSEGPRWRFSFQAQSNPKPWTLRVRQRDVREAWNLSINGRVLGRLPQDENELITLWPLAAGTLVSGENILEIAAQGERADDILVGDVALEERARAEILAAAHVDVTVLDGESGRPIPCRLTLADAAGALVPFEADSPVPRALTTGMVYTPDGKARLGVAPGLYTLYASRGFEYSVAVDRLEVLAGASLRRQLRIRREVPTPGLVSCDTHTHTLEHSGHGDASVTDRVLSFAGEGIELPVMTDHDVRIDVDAAASAAGVRSFFTPVAGAEVTTPRGHFNVFPIPEGARVPDRALPGWPALFESIRRIANVFVVFNHPRNIHAGFRPFAPENFDPLTGEMRNGWKIEAGGMEVVNSAALQSDPLRVYRDWFALLNRGVVITPIGASDSHEIGAKLVGQGRTYIHCRDDRPGEIDVDQALRSLRQGRVAVSMGLLTLIRVEDKYGPGDTVLPGRDLGVSVEVLGPAWTSAERVGLYANGTQIAESRIPRGSQRKAGLKWRTEWRLPRPRYDVNLVAIATGPGVAAPYWRIAKAYQPSTPDWKSYVIGSTGVVWVDADGDGITTAYQYAARLVDKHRDDLVQLFRSLNDYDRAVAIQTAGLLEKRRLLPSGQQMKLILAGAAAPVRQGLEEFLASR